MVDFFLLIMIAGAGDELQGMKKGVIEIADLLAVNKADGDNATRAKLASTEYNPRPALPPARHSRLENPLHHLLRAHPRDPRRPLGQRGEIRRRHP